MSVSTTLDTDLLRTIPGKGKGYPEAQVPPTLNGHDGPPYVPPGHTLVGGPDGPEPEDPFDRILREMSDLHAKKRKDYGTDADDLANLRAAEVLGMDPLEGIVLRMGDKWHRITGALKKAREKAEKEGWTVDYITRLNAALANESLEDSFMDIAVYAILALVRMGELKNG